MEIDQKLPGLFLSIIVIIWMHTLWNLFWELACLLLLKNNIMCSRSLLMIIKQKFPPTVKCCVLGRDNLSIAHLQKHTIVVTCCINFTDLNKPRHTNSLFQGSLNLSLVSNMAYVGTELSKDMDLPCLSTEEIAAFVNISQHEDINLRSKVKISV